MDKHVSSVNATALLQVVSSPPEPVVPCAVASDAAPQQIGETT